jgi:hypothetical protein
LIINDFLHLI